MTEGSGEVDRLRRYSRDLAACLALPAIWGGRHPARIAETLLDVLVSMLHLDVAGLWLRDPDGGAPLEAVRPARVGPAAEVVAALQETLRDSAEGEGGAPVAAVLPRLGRLMLVRVSLGRDGHGAVVAGSSRSDFPAERDRFLLTAAVNQADIALRNAFLVRREQAVLLRERAAREEAEAANLAKDEFLAMLAHELRNPLAPIGYSVEVVRQVARGVPGLERACQVIERQVGHLGRLLDDLLDVSRVTRGLIELDRRVVDLRDVIVEAVETNRALVERHGHRLHVAVPDTPLAVMADRTRLVQVADNLLVNAARYTPSPGDIRVTALREGAEVVLRVCDTGVGIARDMLTRIFDLFVQGDPAALSSRGGLGIGLTLAQRLVLLHGGTITAYSEGPGRGSEFVVRLPATAETAATLSAVDGNAQAPGAHVLVVEDNADSREMLMVLLRLRGYTVAGAGTAAEARHLAGQPLDVALVDIDLPDDDGYSVARHIRRQRPGVLLVAVTGFGQPADRRRSAEAGFDAHLVKPITPEELDRTLVGARRRPLSGAGERTERT